MGRGKRRTKAFYFRVVPEEDAYAAAITLREELDRSSDLGEPKAREATVWDEDRGPVSIIGSRGGKRQPPT